jgi:hypothetical protein
MPLSPDVEAKIMQITGVFTLAFLASACFYGWPAVVACLLMLMIVSFMLRSLDSDHRS